MHVLNILIKRAIGRIYSLTESLTLLPPITTT